MLKRILFEKLLEKHEPNEIQDAIVKIFLQESNLISSTWNELLLEAQKRARDEVVRTIRLDLGEVLHSLDLKTVEYFFEHLFGEKEKREGGIQYTPDYIIEYIVKSAVQHDGNVCDPSCGSGGFLIEAARRISRITGRPVIDVIESSIYGCDISPLAIQRAKLMLSLLAATEGCDRNKIRFNLICADSLVIDWKECFPEVFARGGFDAVIGNPPYVKIQDMGEKSKEIIPRKWSTVGGGSHNLYIPFIQLGAELINNNGILGYIVSSMYFKSIASEKLRQYLQSRRLVSKVIDFGDVQVFDERQTYTCLTFINKKQKDYLEYAYLENPKNLSNLKTARVYYDTLKPKKWRLLSQIDQRNIMKIESAGPKLGILMDISTGIATLKDALYFIDSTTREGDYYVKSYKGKKFYVEERLTREIIKVSDFKTQNELEENTRRIIFPYEVGEQPLVINEQELAEEFPKAYEYLRAIKDELRSRDKGKKSYAAWYAYGRTQGLNNIGEKILNPTFSDKPRFLLCKKKDALFCNGYGMTLRNTLQRRIDADSYEQYDRRLRVIWKILNSSVMDYYMRKTSYVIEGGFYCYQKQFTESFSLPELSEDEASELLRENDQTKTNQFLILKYGIEL